MGIEEEIRILKILLALNLKGAMLKSLFHMRKIAYFA